MYKIGEFSKITNLTIKALHYYDEIDLLKPHRILENGYRMYNEEDFKKATQIQLLKKLNFSINEIKEVLSHISNDSDLQDYLLEKKSMIEQQIKNEKEIIKTIDAYLNTSSDTQEMNIQYEVSIESIPEQLIAFISFQGTYANCSEKFSKLLKSVKSKANGVPFNLYYDNEFKAKAIIDSCIPIKESFSASNIKIKTLPQIQALKTTHIGKYEFLGYGYKALIDYAKDNNIELLKPTREIYLKGPGMFMKGNPNKYITEIYIPIKT